LGLGFSMHNMYFFTKKLYKYVYIQTDIIHALSSYEKYC
jgi:hypothetical protein